jgi:hypothetical protein
LDFFVFNFAKIWGRLEERKKRIRKGNRGKDGTKRNESNF